MRNGTHHSTHPHYPTPLVVLTLLGISLPTGAAGCSADATPDATTGTPPSTSAGEFQLLDEYEPAAEAPGSSAIAADDPRFVAWADGYVEPIAMGSDVDDEWADPEQTLGQASTDTEQVLALGNGGEVTLTFAAPITNGAGADFAVFENSFDDYFLELAFVEVSSNGEDFARFDCAYLGEEPVGQYDTHDTELIGGLAGKYRVGFGTPFDLELLSKTDRVESGDVDLEAITHVKIVDIIGDGSEEDSFDHPIYDPTPTVGSGGFDLDAIGVIHRR